MTGRPRVGGCGGFTFAPCWAIAVRQAFRTSRTGSRTANRPQTRMDAGFPHFRTFRTCIAV